MSSDLTERADLAAMMARVGRALIAAERPILSELGLSMWGYIVLTALGQSPLRGQSALAESIGADKTRLIRVLDDLQARGLISRDPDPDDRRARVLTLTPAGSKLARRAQTAVRRNENRILEGLSASTRKELITALTFLDAQPAELFVPD